MKPIKQATPLKPDCGDLLFGSEYIKCYAKDLYPDLKKDLLGLALPALPLNIYRGVTPEVLGIDYKEALEASKYECPYTGNKHIGLMPKGLVAARYEDYNIGHIKEHFLWLLEPYHLKDNVEEIMRLNPIEEILFGHGYTPYILPSDGSHDRVIVIVELDNGDKLICHTWEWYNK